MVTENFRGYREGADLSKIPAEFLAYPSRNVLVTKGKVVTRGGLENDGTASTGDFPTHSEVLWKDAAGGSRFLRVWGQTVQVKHGDVWFTIFTALDSGVARVIFDTWVDSNGTVIKKRLVFCDGSTSLYTWNGFVGTVASYAPTTLTFVADKANLGLMGTDDGSGTTQTVMLYSLDGNGDVDATDTGTYTTNPNAGLTIALTGAPAFTPVAGDIVIAKPVTFTNAISSTFPIDAIVSYKNHIVAANYDSVETRWSHVQTYALASGFDFTQPVAASRTALTPVIVYLTGNFTAMAVRKNVLWVSDANRWYKMTKTEEINAYDLWVDVEYRDPGERKGALPMALASHKDDLIYLAQDATLQRITTLDVLEKDDFQLLSDDVEGMFQRFDLDDVRLYYYGRGIFFILPTEGVMLILDTAEQEWYFQPPQDIPIQCMTEVGGVKYGHHNARNETYELFTGRQDLDAARAEAVIATGYQHDGHHFRFKKHSNIGMDCRMTNSTNVLWERMFEEDGAKATGSSSFVGSDHPSFNGDVDASWATSPYGSYPHGGDDSANDVYRHFVFAKDRVDGYFETRPIITISGDESEFHLLAIWAEDVPSARKISDDLFIAS